MTVTEQVRRASNRQLTSPRRFLAAEIPPAVVPPKVKLVVTLPGRAVASKAGAPKAGVVVVLALNADVGVPVFVPNPDVMLAPNAGVAAAIPEAEPVPKSGWVVVGLVALSSIWRETHWVMMSIASPVTLSKREQELC